MPRRRWVATFRISNDDCAPEGIPNIFATGLRRVAGHRLRRADTSATETHGPERCPTITGHLQPRHRDYSLSHLRAMSSPRRGWPIFATDLCGCEIACAADRGRHEKPLHAPLAAGRGRVEICRCASALGGRDRAY